MATNPKRQGAPVTPSGHDDGREWFVRLIDGMRDDIKALREGSTDTERSAQEALGKLEELERRMGQVEDQSQETADSMIEIKAVGRAAGMIAGAVTGALGGLLMAFVMKLLHLS